VVLLTGQGSIDSAVRAIKEGAYDYLTKPVDPTRLQLVVDRALERTETTREVQLLRRQLRQRGACGRLVGSSGGMREVMRQVEVAAPTDATLLIAGESGTGKELVARTVHRAVVAAGKGAVRRRQLRGHSETTAGERDLRPREGLLHRRRRAPPGLLRIGRRRHPVPRRGGGDEPGTQAKFLRVLQEGQFRRLGAQSETHVNVRIVAATNKDPMKALQDGALREDLYYRLNVLTITVPPLRERMEDIPELVQAFIDEFNERHGRSIRGIDDDALEVLRRHRWPGNVRELRNVIERAVIVCPDDLVRAEHLPAFDEASLPTPSGTEAEVVLSVGTTVEDAERELILKTLKQTGGNKTRAAVILGISLKTLHNKLHKYRG
jgi:DNA-binding NtrC family response regulator